MLDLGEGVKMSHVYTPSSLKSASEIELLESVPSNSHVIKASRYEHIREIELPATTTCGLGALISPRSRKRNDNY